MSVRLTEEQYDELNSLQYYDTEEFNRKLEELLDVRIVPTTVYQYFDGDTFIGDSHNSMLTDILREIGVSMIK